MSLYKRYRSRTDHPSDMDVPYNPYHETHFTPPCFVEASQKVHMEKSSHKYVLITDNGKRAYPGNIISGSKLIAYANGLVKVEDGTLSLKDFDRKNLEPFEGKTEKDFYDQFKTLFEPQDLPAPPPRILSGRMYQASLGNVYHWYVECFFLGHPQEKEKFTVLEKELNQFHVWMKKIPFDYVTNVEQVFGSNRHKLCGSDDACHFRKSKGKYHLVDHKRSSKLFERGKKSRHIRDYRENEKPNSDYSNWYSYEDDVEISDGVRARVYHPHIVNDELFGYMIQLACYRKLRNLNGKPTSRIAYIWCVNEDFVEEDGEDETCVHVIRLDLGKSIKDFVNIVPVGMIEWIFHEREKQVQRNFKKRLEPLDLSLVPERVTPSPTLRRPTPSPPPLVEGEKEEEEEGSLSRMIRMLSGFYSSKRVKQEPRAVGGGE